MPFVWRIQTLYDQSRVKREKAKEGKGEERMRSAYETLNDKLSAWNLFKDLQESGRDMGDMGFEISRDIIIWTTAYKFERLKQLEIEKEELLR